MFKEKVIHHRMTTQLVVQVHMYISEVVLGLLVLDATATVVAKTCHSFWSNYSDLTRPHPKWWFSKGNPRLFQGNLLVGEVLFPWKSKTIK